MNSFHPSVFLSFYIPGRGLLHRFHRVVQFQGDLDVLTIAPNRHVHGIPHMEMPPYPQQILAGAKLLSICGKDKVSLRIPAKSPAPPGVASSTSKPQTPSVACSAKLITVMPSKGSG